ncbi:MAG TPA: hypothetical protein VFR09_05765 [Alphaproteobacteria bacterium]|nr:hypothetical protein [Alphaproteobacteria bacterium]
MLKRIEVADFTLPVSTDESITITSKDLGSAGQLSPRLAMAIAKAFKHQKKTARPSTNNKRFDRYPEVTFAISHVLLGKHEKKPIQGDRFADWIENFSLLKPGGQQRRKLRDRIGAQIIPFVKIVEEKTGGRYTAGFREDHIVIINTQLKNIDLTIHGKVFSDAIPVCDFRTGHHDGPQDNRTYRGFPIDVLRALEKAGQEGLAVQEKGSEYYIDGIKRGYKFKALRSMLSDTNSYLRAESGFNEVTLTIAGGRLRLLDLGNDGDFLLYQTISRDPGKNNAYVFAAAAREAAQHSVIGQTGMSAPQAPSAAMPERAAMKYEMR